MGWSYDLTCDGCGYQQRDFQYYLLEAYVLPDGGIAPIPYQVGWCRRCRAFVRTELPADKLVRFADAWEARIELRRGEELRARRRTESGWLRAVAAGRQSPPRCLTCGSAEVVGLGPFKRPFTHPGCGGSVAYSRSVHRFLHPSPLAAFSPEGEALGVKVVRAKPSDTEDGDPGS